ncbi:hypothetical protein JXA12_02525 [Candidatus Woesearchaeota archaeon]|nr:hypothetical protein [Candidatus Woesearchaeota archaeon]
MRTLLRKGTEEGALGLVGKLVLLLIVIFVVLAIFKGNFINPLNKATQCESQGTAYTCKKDVCPPGLSPAIYKCNGDQVCCYDPEALMSEKTTPEESDDGDQEGGDDDGGTTP